VNLNWGCAGVISPRWYGSDRDDYGQDHVGDIADGLPWPDGTFDIVVTHHTLQMLAYPQLVPALAELRRVLRPNGVLRLSVPDLERAWRAYENNDAGHFLIDDGIERSLDGKLCAYLSQCGSTRSVFTGPWLCELVRRVGFLDAWLVSFGATCTNHTDCVELDTRPAESVFVEAVK
jgi:SAM-dependent methyltransferase